MLFSGLGAAMWPGGLAAQSAKTGGYGERISTLINIEEFVRNVQRQQIEALEKEMREEKNINIKPPSGLPDSVREPWVYTPTLDRRSGEENRRADVRRREIEKIRRAGSENPAFTDSLKAIWYSGVSADFAHSTEREVQLFWLGRLNIELADKTKRLRALNGASRQVAEKQLENEIRLAERLACIFVCSRAPTHVREPGGKGKQVWAEYRPVPPKTLAKTLNPLPPDTRRQRADPGSPRPVLKKMTGFSSGILFQMGLHHEQLTIAAQNADVATRLKNAAAAWGTGRAGGGGVSLHVPAKIEGGLDTGRITRAVIEDGRLVLVMNDGGRVRLPPVSQDVLAVALRTIYGPSALLPGKLVATDGEALVLETGAEKFGEVVWRRSYLPRPWRPVKVGEKTELAVPPAVGLMEIPEPSMQRITFYGDIKDTRLGSVISRADQLLLVFMSGINEKTGKFVPPLDIPGYMTLLEANVRKNLGLIKVPESAPAEKTAAGPKDKKPWWYFANWIVWVPEKIRLIYDPRRGEITTVEVKVKLDVWTTDPTGPGPMERRMADWVNANFPALSAHFPVLKQLQDVALSVGIVRWLKNNDIAVDLAWAQQRKVKVVPTPERIRLIDVYPVTDDKGLPIFQSPGGGSGK